MTINRMNDSIRIAQRIAGDVRWSVVEDWQHDLFDNDQSVVEQHLANGQATVVKQGAQRTVYRIDLPRGAIFIKHHHRPALLAAGKQRLRGTASRREWDRTRELARRNIPTVKPVAWGEQLNFGGAGDHYFVTEAIEHAWPLDKFIDVVLPRHELMLRRRLVEALAQFVAAVHLAGVDHDDLHPGNVLVQLTAADAWTPRLYLIDVPKIRFTRAFGWRRSRDSLAMFAAGFIYRATPRDRWRFWRSYCLARPDLALGAARAAARQADRKSLQHARQIFDGRDRRCLRNNTEFYRLRTKDGVAHAVRELPSDILRDLLAAPANALRAALYQPLKLSHSSVVVETQLPTTPQFSQVALKRYRAKQWWKRLLGPLRTSRARIGWQRGHALLARGIATARPLVMIEPKGVLATGESYLATAWIPGSMNLHLYAWRLRERSPDERRRRTRQVAASLGCLVGRMHRWHIAHRDLKGCNLLITEDADTLQTYLVDLDGLGWRRKLSWRVRVRDLARLAASVEAHDWISRADRWRFLRAYFEHLEGAECIADKDLWRDVAKHVCRVRQRLLRRGWIA